MRCQKTECVLTVAFLCSSDFLWRPCWPAPQLRWWLQQSSWAGQRQWPAHDWILLLDLRCKRNRTQSSVREIRHLKNEMQNFQWRDTTKWIIYRGVGCVKYLQGSKGRWPKSTIISCQQCFWWKFKCLAAFVYKHKRSFDLNRQKKQLLVLLFTQQVNRNNKVLSW